MAFFVVSQQAGTPHALHFLDVADEQYKARLRRRNASGLQPFFTSEAQVDDITRHLVPPDVSERLHVVQTAA